MAKVELEGKFCELRNDGVLRSSLLASFVDQGPICALDAPRPVLEGAQDLPPLGGVDDVGHRPRAEDEVGAGLPRTVHDLVSVRRTRRPACRVAGVEGMRPIFLDHGRLARKHVEELVFLLVPVPVPRARARLQRLDVRDELGQPALLGEVQRLTGSIGLLIFCGSPIYRCLVFLYDHLGAPKVWYLQMNLTMLPSQHPCKASRFPARSGHASYTSPVGLRV